MTPKKIAALRWFKEKGPVKLFPLDGSAPTMQMRRILERDGLIEKAPRERNEHFVSMVAYRLSEAGARALESAS